MKVRYPVITVNQMVSQGHVLEPVIGSVDLYKSVDEAITHVRDHRIDKRSYNGIVVYKAVAIVRRTAPPIDVIPIEAEAEED